MPPGHANKKVRVLHFIDHSRVGGPGKTILNSAKYIDRDRYEVHAALFCNGSGTDFSITVEERGIPCLTLRDRNGIEWSHIRDLREYIRRERIDILHTHGYKTDFLGVVQKRLSRGIVLVTTHHGWIRNNMRQNIYALTGMGLSRFFDGVIIVSGSLEKFLPRRVRKSGSFRVVHNAIVLSDYESPDCESSPAKGEARRIREEFDISGCDTLIGVIGRLSEEKGCSDMLAAFHEIREIREFRKGRGNLKLMFIGEGSLRAELERMKEDLGLGKDVVFAGFRDPVAPFYRAIDILVCPSRTEGLSNVILEAMACRVPVIATDVGGNAEIITSGTNGFIISSVKDLRGPLEKLSNDRALRESIVRNASETVRQKFSFEARMRKVEDFYAALLNGRQTARHIPAGACACHDARNKQP
ncbi:MAG: glycosyltransferase family 4 protein [Syntrophaceae bacterium]